MTDGASVTVPPQIILARVDDLTALRTLDSDIQLPGNPCEVIDELAIYAWIADSLTADNGTTIIRPNDRTSLQAGRWYAIITADSQAFVDALGKYLGPYDNGAAITPANTNIGPYQALYVGGPGAVTFELSNGGVVTYPDCFAGQIIQVDYVQVRTATTATQLVGLTIVDTPIPAFYSNIVAVAPADADLPDGPCNGVFVGTGGDVAVKLSSGTIVTFLDCPSSRTLPIQASQVRAATTATDILATYP